MARLVLIGLVAAITPATPASAATGDITTVAGSGDCTPDPLTLECEQYGGDGGPATSALLNAPQSPAFDAAGNMYFADMRNNRVRKVAPVGRRRERWVR